jgi:hypothetical protein
VQGLIKRYSSNGLHTRTSGLHWLSVLSWKKPKDLSVCESEERGCGEGGGVYVTLMESDTVESSGRTEGDTRPGRTWKKPKDLSVCESAECGCGEGVPPLCSSKVSTQMRIK